MKIVNVVGARPNFMKIAPIQRVMQKYESIKPVLVHTGQHYDEKMSKLFFEDLELPQPDVYLDVGSASHSVQTAKIMIAFEEVLESERPDLILVVGDVNSTAACSLVAAKMGIKIGHVEAGLRSFDRTMPEEINRIITDTLSDFLFVTEKSGLENLKNEGIDDSKVFFTGHVMIDSLIYFLEKSKQSKILDEMNLNGTPFVLVTLHRPSNVDNKEVLGKLLQAFEKIGKYLKIVFPIHPRTSKMITAYGLDKLIETNQNLLLIDPIGYLDFMNLMQNAKLVLTDSGGIQEETTYLRIPCLTMRENTERPVTVDIGTNTIVGSDMHKIVSETEKILQQENKMGEIPELWDGKAAERIVDVIMKHL